MLTPALVAFVAVSVAALLAWDAAQRPRRAFWAKVCASAGFVVLGAVHRDGHTFDDFILFGLVCAAAGDVALALPGERSFLLGVGAFALGHLAYAAAASTYAWPQEAPGYAHMVWVPSLIAYRWLYPHLGAMRVVVAAYVIIIGVMVICALAVWSLQLAGGGLFATGALLFYGSDLSVARDRFVRSGFGNRAWGLPMYYAAQVCIALSTVWL